MSTEFKHFGLLILGSAGTGKTNLIVNQVYEYYDDFDEIILMTYPHSEPLYDYLAKHNPKLVIIHDLKDMPPRSGKKRLEIFDEAVHGGRFLQDNNEMQGILKTANANNTSWIATEFIKQYVPNEIQDMATEIISFNYGINKTI